MSVSLDDAMITLTGMFTNIDKEVIMCVLEANQGHMERTVECLLGMDGENPPTETTQAPLASVPSTTLPSDFLGGDFGGAPPASNPAPVQPSQADLDEDERLARQLQEQFNLEEASRIESGVISGDGRVIPSMESAPPRDRSNSGDTLKKVGENLKAGAEAVKEKMSSWLGTKRGSNDSGNAKYSTLEQDESLVISSSANDTLSRRNVFGHEDDDNSLEDRRLSRSPQSSSINNYNDDGGSHKKKD